MCFYKPLVHSENGYIVQCEKCNSLHIAFGTSALTLSTHNSQLFFEQLLTLRDCTPCNGLPNQKRIKVDVFAGHILMILSLHELNIFISMFEEAEAKLQVDGFLEECNIEVSKNV